MKKRLLLSVMLGAISLSGLAQDDMYFVPSKSSARGGSYSTSSDAYYSGSSRSVDDYNRRWGSSYEVLPADTGDIISFAAVQGVYPDSVGSDFELTQRMARWDGYEPSSAYWAGYVEGYRDRMWHSPWYYSSYYPWYDYYWYDPWYWDPWYYGYYDPWRWHWGYGYYGYYGYRPYYSYGWGGGGIVTHYSPGTYNHGRPSASANRGFISGRTHTYSSGTFGSRRGLDNSGSFGSTSRSGNYGGTSTRTRTYSSSPATTYSNSNGNFGGSRSTGGSYSGGGSYSSGGSSGGGGGSFGGSRSGGGGGGGTRSGGGGGFGSGRR
ncbi:MAG: hypothetical protein K6D55_01230 [Prevotella sp.]|nr:hypothetical protein [Prevotella sp.]